MRGPLPPTDAAPIGTGVGDTASAAPIDAVQRLLVTVMLLVMMVASKYRVVVIHRVVLSVNIFRTVYVARTVDASPSAVHLLRVGASQLDAVGPRRSAVNHHHTHRRVVS